MSYIVVAIVFFTTGYISHAAVAAFIAKAKAKVVADATQVKQDIIAETKDL